MCPEQPLPEIKSGECPFPFVSLEYSPSACLTICRIPQSSALSQAIENYQGRFPDILYSLAGNVYQYAGNYGLHALGLSVLQDLQEVEPNVWEQEAKKVIHLSSKQGILSSMFPPDEIMTSYQGQLVLVHGLAHDMHKKPMPHQLVGLFDTKATFEQVIKARALLFNLPAGIQGIMSSRMNASTEDQTGLDLILPTPLILDAFNKTPGCS